MSNITERSIYDVFTRLRERGELPIVLAPIQARIAALEKRLRGELKLILLTDQEALSTFNARQGALAELEILVGQLHDYARGVPEEPAVRDSSSDGLASRRGAR